MYNLINKVDEITAYHGGAFFYFWKVVKHVVCSRMNWQMVSYFQENMLWEAWKTDFWLFENSRVGGRLFCKAYWKPFFEKCTGTLIAYTTTDWPDLFLSQSLYSVYRYHIYLEQYDCFFIFAKWILRWPQNGPFFLRRLKFF